MVNNQCRAYRRWCLPLVDARKAGSRVGRSGRFMRRKWSRGAVELAYLDSWRQISIQLLSSIYSCF